MSRLQEIFEGWKNFTFQNPRIEQDAKKRIKICTDCPMLNSRNICQLCGCYMPAKVRSPKSHCLIKKW
jgi:recombinational DNA repair protein RecR